MKIITSSAISAAMTTMLIAAAFCGISCKKTQEQAAPADPEPNKTLRILSWNVRMNERDGKDRIASLLKTIGSADADIIALQGVWPQLLDAMVKESWAAGYQKFKNGEQPDAPNGLLVWSKFKMVMKLRSEPDMGENQFMPMTLAMAAKMTVNGRSLVIVDTKLDPRLEKANVRKRQLLSLYSLFEGANDVILAGDMSFGDGESEQSAIDKNLTDVWSALKPDEKGFTWDMETNGLAKKYAYFGEKSRRIDRVFVWSYNWSPQDIRLIGTDPVKPGDPSLFPSDHFGLLVTLKLDHRPAPAPASSPASEPASQVSSKPAAQSAPPTDK